MLELFEEVLKLKYKGEEISLPFPTVLQFEEYQEKMKETKSELKLAREFLVELGMNEETAKSLQMNNLRKIIEELVAQKKR